MKDFIRPHGKTRSGFFLRVPPGSPRQLSGVWIDEAATLPNLFFARALEKRTSTIWGTPVVSTRSGNDAWFAFLHPAPYGLQNMISARRRATMLKRLVREAIGCSETPKLSSAEPTSAALNAFNL